MVEEFFDNLIMIVTMFLAIIFVALFWKEEAQQRYVAYMVSEFAESVSTKGYISKEDYSLLVSSISNTDSGLTVKLSHTHLSQVPYYHYYDETELASYFISRNTRKNQDIEVKQEEVLREEETSMKAEELSELRLQTETTESLLAHGILLQLPTINQRDTMAAVLPLQSVYVNEPLITLCMKSENGKQFLLEADEVCVNQEGRATVELTINQEPIGVFVDVIAYSREWICDNNHVCSNTKERIQYEEENGTQAPCPICVITPNRMQASNPVVYLELGEPISKAKISYTITYMDGHTKEILPESDGWIDNYDSEYFGVQQVEVSYQGLINHELIVITKPNLCITCNQDIGIRNYCDTKDYPLCNRCMAKVPTFIGEVTWEEQRITTDEIISNLSEEDYLMKKGDTLEIKVHSRKDETTIRDTITIVSERGDA